jgi:hypothetical protein
MYLGQPSADLRQGDILGEAFYASPWFDRLRDGKLVLPSGGRLHHARLVAMSNCCDLAWDKDNQGNLKPRRQYVLVAPLSKKIPFRPGTDEYRKLIENGINRPDKDPVQYFYFQDHPALGGDAMVDLSSMMTIKSATLRDICPSKLLELTVRDRHLLRTRLREYFSRIPDEEWEEVRRLFPGDFA